VGTSGSRLLHEEEMKPGIILCMVCLKKVFRGFMKDFFPVTFSPSFIYLIPIDRDNK
jgi:hypothetical protein